MSPLGPRRCIASAFALILVSHLGAQDLAGTARPQVEAFTPQGHTRQVRQVSARFSAPMVALGDPRLDDPFVIDCPATGKGRWADGRNWIYDFDQDLPAGLSCRFMLKTGLKSLAGEPAVGDTGFRFDTGGPAIIASLPREGWEELDEDQVFLLKLDAPTDDDSVRANAYCVVDGIEERIPIELLGGAERQAVLAQRRALGYDYLQLLWKNGGVSNARVRDRTLEDAEDRIVALRCQRHLPPATRVRLIWAAGIRTASGLATQTDQQLAFRVRAAFMAQVECTRTNARSGCIPVQPIEVNFTAPVPRAVALAIRLQAKGRTLLPQAEAADAEADGAAAANAPAAANAAAADAPTVTGVHFAPPFPESTTLTVVLPPALKDDAGRPLGNAERFPLSVPIDAYPPLAKFSGSFGILELREGGVLPVTLRNVESRLTAAQTLIPGKMLRLDNDPAAIAAWLQRVERATAPRGEWVAATGERAGSPLKAKIEDQESEDDFDAHPGHLWRDDTGSTSVFEPGESTTTLTVRKPSGEKPAEVVGIPLRKPGFYVIELQSRALGRALLGRDDIRYVATSALVTDLVVHFKWGRESSRVWVTRLNDATPIADADVVVTDSCSGAALWRGRTGRDGTAAILKPVGDPNGGSGCNNFASHPLLVLAKKGDDFSFTQTSWSGGITPYEFALPVGSSRDTAMVHSVLDRMLFRAGETVSMKHYWRCHVLDGIEIPERIAGSHTVTITHEGSGQVYSLAAIFGSDGVAENQWIIPQEAKLGDYSIAIDRHVTGRFKVEQFRLPSMHGSVIGSTLPLVRARQADLDLHVAYLSGGGAAGLEVKLRTLVEPRPVHFADYPDYQFGGAPVQEGLTATGNGPADFDFENSAEAETTRTRIVPATLDGAGSARVTVDDLPALDGPAQLTAELEYADANGEILTSTGHVRLVPSSINVGLRREGWVGSAEQLRFRVVALDLEGKPAARQPITVALYQSTAYSYRKRLIGGFYAYETTRETRKIPARCSGLTDAAGVLACEVAPGVSGQIIVRAETRDPQGGVAGATTSIWVAGKEDWWFGGTTGDRMDLLPEKKEYEAGEIARFQVRMPFRSATALVTVEREGVLRSFVTRLTGSTPVVEVPIEAADSPNVFVSVLAVRGRVAHIEHGSTRIASADEITALVDLNKPAYRLGMAQIKVGWKPHRLDVRVTPAQAVYQVRDQVTTRIHVSAADGQPLAADTEVAVSAVDEALLDLAGNPSWDLLDAMMGQRGVEVWTSTAQMQVVGKRHYGRKAVPHGGGGGREGERARELFDSLLYWKSRLPVDEHGDVTVTIPLNDSLSSFRIVAVAHSGAQRFGSGTASVRTTQDVMLLSGLPPLVREADRFAATFTVRNTTDHALSVRVRSAMTPAADTPLPAQTLDIPAGQARDVSWPVIAPARPALNWDVTASEVGGSAADHLHVTEAVIPAFPVRTYQATIAQLTHPLSLTAERPTGALPGRGGLEVTLQARLADRLDGVREYMSLYPYICFEQLASRAVTLRDRAQWDRLMTRLPAYADGDGLLRYFPTDRLEGDDSLTAYVLSIADEAGWALPDADRERATRALTRFVRGQIVRRSTLPTADLSLRKLAAIAALARYGAAEPSMLDSITVEPSLWPTSAVLDWIDILKRVRGIPETEAKTRTAFDLLRARLTFQGTTLGFSTERSDALWWLMISADSNTNRLLLAALPRPDWRGDIPRLVRGALGRQQSGHWNTTVANAWGVLAMEKFSAAFESTPVGGSSQVRYGAADRRVTWPQPGGSTRIDLPWTVGRSDLAITHSGPGAPWAMVRATAALPLDRPLSTGFRIARTVTPVEQHESGAWTRGDVARVHLELDAQSDMSWVVVDDPIPAGATVLGSGLGGQSQLVARDERPAGWAWLAFEERRFDDVRAYYRFVPKGHWTIDYTLRLNNPGTFLLPATRVEAMYAPEMLGELPNAPMLVKATP
jgi:uncharacterized protein YfaS (alpha-2-macroglobulin family)